MSAGIVYKSFWGTIAAKKAKGKGIVEVSFKKKTESKAREARGRLLALLRGHPGWLVEDDVLKTDLVLDRCFPPK